MGKRKIESSSPKSTRFRSRERAIYIDEPSNDSVIRHSCTEEMGHESLTLKPIYRAVNISELKRFAAKRLPINSPLRNVLLSERDQLTAKDFLVKMDIWIRLLNIEKSDLPV